MKLARDYYVDSLAIIQANLIRIQSGGAQVEKPEPALASA